MASRSTPARGLGDVVDIDVTSEMEGSFLEYAYSVIYARALPDARDGLKPVQRRILFQMAEMGLRPDRGHVKSARVVGEVMGKLHPHGDTAIYDALVRMAQPFSLRLPLVDGHGNFGSLDDGPAAPRYTEARLAPAAMVMTAGLDEDVVDMVPNYDNQFLQPSVLPSALPNLLVNGASGIAVGMATNMPPHNLVEVVAAARHLIANPDATLEDLMRFVPGPDLPGGGKIIGLDGIREAYETGRGTFRTRATTRVENITARRKGIVVTELPYLVGPEKAKAKIADVVRAKKVQGVTDVVDLSDRKKGMRLVIEIKTGFNPEAVLEQLFRATPLEESFGINNVALVDGQPRTLGLRELLRVYVAHRLEVTLRRTRYRLRKRQERLHLVLGLLIAIADIDEVIAVIRSSDDAAAARERLIAVFDLTQAQAEYILELPAAPAHQVLDDRAGEGAGRAGAADRRAGGDPRRRRGAAPGGLRRVRRGGGRARHTAAHRAAGVGRVHRRHRGGGCHPRGSRTWPRRCRHAAGGAGHSDVGPAQRHRPGGAHRAGDDRPPGRGPGPPRRPHLGGDDDGARDARCGHLHRADRGALGPRRTDPPADRRPTEPGRRCSRHRAGDARAW